LALRRFLARARPRFGAHPGAGLCGLPALARYPAADARAAGQIARLYRRDRRLRPGDRRGLPGRRRTARDEPAVLIFWPAPHGSARKWRIGRPGTTACAAATIALASMP